MFFVEWQIHSRGRARNYLAVINTAFLCAMQHTDFIGLSNGQDFL
jgi:hypothetical protein